jgi:N-acetylneuraminate synthase
MNQIYIIAEAGVNHNGSVELAKQLIERAAEAGADAVKFQSFISEKVVSALAPKANYQKRTTDRGESQLEMLKKLELDEEAHQILIEHCKHCHIEFLSTPFDIESLHMLTDRFRLQKIKLPSGEITNAPLLLEAGRSRKSVILSTGMSSLGEIEDALAVLAFGFLNEIEMEPSEDGFQKAYASMEGQKILRDKVSLLHCTSEYPAPFEEINLRTMDTLKESFGLRIGLSDHSIGISVPIAAAARGAMLIEKHFTLDKTFPGPDHKASIEPNELKQMVQSIREVELALGNPYKIPTKSELINKRVVRKSLVASRDIQEGEQFTTSNVTFKRPGNGVSPMRYWEMLGSKANKHYKKDELI